MKTVNFKMGEVIYKKGMKIDKFLIVIEGNLKKVYNLKKEKNFIYQ